MIVPDWLHAHWHCTPHVPRLQSRVACKDPWTVAIPLLLLVLLLAFGLWGVFRCVCGCVPAALVWTCVAE